MWKVSQDQLKTILEQKKWEIPLSTVDILLNEYEAQKGPWRSLFLTDHPLIHQVRKIRQEVISQKKSSVNLVEILDHAMHLGSFLRNDDSFKKAHGRFIALLMLSFINNTEPTNSTQKTTLHQLKVVAQDIGKPIFELLKGLCFFIFAVLTLGLVSWDNSLAHVDWTEDAPPVIQPGYDETIIQKILAISSLIEQKIDLSKEKTQEILSNFTDSTFFGSYETQGHYFGDWLGNTQGYIPPSGNFTPSDKKANFSKYLHAPQMQMQKPVKITPASTQPNPPKNALLFSYHQANGPQTGAPTLGIPQSPN